MYNNIVITGTGRYEPTEIVDNKDFLEHDFYSKEGKPIDKNNEEIIKKFEEITNIKRRKYVNSNLVTSDIAAKAGQKAIESAIIDPESLSGIIVAHNFGDVAYGSTQSDFVPSIGSRVKQKLDIRNPKVVAKDIIFGCPGWLEGMIDAYRQLREKDGKMLVIGAETLSRISDPHDVDSMIYADGAGAAVLETIEQPDKLGILSHNTHTYTSEESEFLHRKISYKPGDKDGLFLKMDGHKVYNFALNRVPEVVKENLASTGTNPEDVKKIIIHQANQKMDEKILQRIQRLYKKDLDQVLALPENKNLDKMRISRLKRKYTFEDNIMPMIIEDYGNSSVATIPILFDLMARGKMPCHDLKRGDTIVFTSVGAGMNINSMIYRMHQDLSMYQKP